MKSNSMKDERAFRYVMTIVVISVIFFMVRNITYPSLNVPMHYEKIEIIGFPIVTKTAHTYAVTISFVNTGDRRTGVDSVLLNGIPYDDSGWSGTLTPIVSGDLMPVTVIDAHTSYSGKIMFGDGCIFLPIGIEPMTDVLVTITIHSIGAKDYNISVTPL